MGGSFCCQGDSPVSTSCPSGEEPLAAGSSLSEEESRTRLQAAVEMRATLPSRSTASKPGHLPGPGSSDPFIIHQAYGALWCLEGEGGRRCGREAGGVVTATWHTLQESRAVGGAQSGTPLPSPLQRLPAYRTGDLEVQVRVQEDRHQRPLLAMLFHCKASYIQARTTSCFLVVPAPSFATLRHVEHLITG